MSSNRQAEALSVALITKNEAEIPAWVVESIRSSGIRLDIRKCTTRQQLLECAGAAQVIWTVGANTCLTAEALLQLPRCKAILRSGSGLDDIPVEAARAAGIMVLNTPEAIAEIVAEHAVALLLSLTRQVPQHDREVRAGSWNSAPEWARWHACGQTLGLIGFGLIARQVVRMLQGFRMKFLVCDPYADAATVSAHGGEQVELDELLQRSDFVSVHCPLTAGTKNLLSSREFSMMKPGALLINTSRGAVVDEQAMIQALRDGRLAGAALDVLEDEPPAAANPLLHLDNVILTPHIAAFSDEFEQKFWNASIAKILWLHEQLELQ